MKDFLPRSVVLAACCLSLAGCGGSTSVVFEPQAVAPSGANTSSMDADPPQQLLDNETVEPANRKIIKDGELRFETSDRQAAWETIESAVRKHQGYVADDREQQYGKSQSRTVVVRVPAKSFDGLVADVCRVVDRFDTRRIEAKDVTEQFVDLEARLNVRKATEQRLIELLSKAADIEEILKIEKQISALRETIDSAEGQLRYLRNRVSLSTLTITFYEARPFLEAGFIVRLKGQLMSGWEATVECFLGIVVLWPLLLLAGLVLFAVRHRSNSPTSNPV